MLKQTMKIYDAQDNLILTKSRTVEDETLEMDFQAKVEIENNIYDELYKDYFGMGEWDEGSASETQIYSTKYRERTGDYTWLSSTNDNKEINAGRFVIEEEYVDDEEESDDEKYIVQDLNDPNRESPVIDSFDTIEEAEAFAREWSADFGSCTIHKDGCEVMHIDVNAEGADEN